MRLRVSDELYKALGDVAKNCDLPVGDLVRRATRGICRGRVVQNKTPEMDDKAKELATLSGTGRMLSVRGCDKPENMEAGEFRTALALRCLEELAKPAPAPKPRFNAVEGKDYIIVDMEQ